LALALLGAALLDRAVLLDGAPPPHPATPTQPTINSVASAARRGVRLDALKLFVDDLSAASGGSNRGRAGIRSVSQTG